MCTPVAIRMTRKGLLIPLAALGDLGAKELEAVREEDRIVICPKPAATDERTQVRQVLRAAGLLYEPDWEMPAPVSPQKRARLARKPGQSQPVSEIVIAERQDRV